MKQTFLSFVARKGVSLNNSDVVLTKHTGTPFSFIQSIPRLTHPSVGSKLDQTPFVLQLAGFCTEKPPPLPRDEETFQALFLLVWLHHVDSYTPLPTAAQRPNGRLNASGTFEYNHSSNVLRLELMPYCFPFLPDPRR
jgi:hypothetical protein